MGKFNPFSLNSSKKADRWRQMQRQANTCAALYLKNRNFKLRSSEIFVVF